MITDAIFDFYGTLVDIRTDESREELWEILAEEFAADGILPDPVQLRAAYEELVRREEKKLEAKCPDGCGEIRLERVFAGLFPDRCPGPEDSLVWKVGQRFRALSRNYLRPYPGTAEMLRSLKEAGKRVWLLSNAQRIFTAPEIEAVGLDGSFDGIYLSSDHGVKKPSADFYRILLEERGIVPDRAMMIGNDGHCDIQGAAVMGLRTLYIHSATSPAEDTPKADHVLACPDMAKVLEILLG